MHSFVTHSNNIVSSSLKLLGFVLRNSQDLNDQLFLIHLQLINNMCHGIKSTSGSHVLNIINVLLLLK